MSVGQASGLALAEAAAAGCEVVQYTPNQVKEAVVGYGAATKAQVQRLVQARLEPRGAAESARRGGCSRARALPPRVGAVASALGASMIGSLRDRVATLLLERSPER